MNYNVVLYCKTYINDFPRLSKLVESIEEHNKDLLPVYISCPSSDIPALKETLGHFVCTIIPDEEIYQPRNVLAGWENQMLIKLHAFKAIPADNILILDSDSYFIRDFYKFDFIAYDNIPYTIIHENVQQSEYETNLKNGTYSETGYAKAVQAYRSIFGGKSNRIYDYGPNPHLWNRVVLEHFEENYLNKHKIEMEDFQLAMKQQFGIHFRETLTYGEYLLAAKPIDIIPCGPLFKVYHWKELYDFENSQGWVKEEGIQKTYLGIIKQSNWS